MKTRCGFSDVRKKNDRYFCSVCGKKLGADFAARVLPTLSKKQVREFKKQISC